MKDNANLKTFIPFRKLFKAEGWLFFVVVAVLVFKREKDMQ